MGIKELAAKVAEQHSQLSVAQATAVLRTALTAMREELEATAEGSVRMAPLGHFKVSSKEGKGEDAAAKRKISLRLAGERDEAAGAELTPERQAKRAEKQAEREVLKAERSAKRAKRAAKGAADKA